MKMLLLLACVVAVAVIMTGCAGVASAPVVPPPGIIYTNTSAPLNVEVDKTEFGTLRGEASTECILGLVAWGDASIKAAAGAKGIKVVRHVDYTSYNVLLVYSKYTTVVYGD